MTAHGDQRLIRWGILGTARIAARIAPAIQATPGAELAAVASRDARRAAEWAAQHGVPRSFGSYAALLDEADIDAVYIPLPPSLHAESTIRAAERGKHVLCEKPLAATFAAAAEMAAACRQHRRQLMDGVMWLHHPRAAAMQSVLRAGTLGPLRRVTSAFTFVAAQFPPDDHRFQHELGGGSLLDLGWYCVGATLWTTGRLPRRVWALGRYQSGVDRTFSGQMQFDEDLVASFDCGFETTARKWLEVAGTEASLICDDFPRPWNEEKPRFWIHNQAGKSAEQVAPVAQQEHCMVARFCDLARRPQPDETWPQLSLQVQQACAALDQAARTQHPVELPS